MSEAFTLPLECSAHFVVPADHPSLAGHFPGSPIVPGVVLLDLVLEQLRTVLPVTIELLAVSSTKFQRAVQPDEPIDLTMRITPDSHQSALRARFQLMSRGRSVAAGSLILGVVRQP